MAVQTRYTLPIHTTAVGTNHDTYFPSNNGKISTKGASEVTLVLIRTADTGACTLVTYPEYLYEPTNAWFGILDMNNATATELPSLADGAYNPTVPYFLTLRTAPIEVDADAVKIVNTVHKVYQVAFIPAFIRFRFRHGGTTVSNTFSAYCVLGGVS